MMQFTITEDDLGQRIDQIIMRYAPLLSRSFIQKLCKEGRVLLDERVVAPGFKVKQLHKLYIDYDQSELESIPEIELPILYEDEDVLVIDKPAGVITHNRGIYWNEPSVASFLRKRVNQSYLSDSAAMSRLQSQRIGIVHRLDRATSGVLICAKNAETLAHLQKQFEARKVRKTYLALVEGELAEPKMLIDLPLERNPRRPQTVHVNAHGKSAQTQLDAVSTHQGLTLVELTPRTGRTHQLRVHCAHIGHPIIGDTLYGLSTADKELRLYLHATRLEVCLPSGEVKQFISPMPTEFKTRLES